DGLLGADIPLGARVIAVCDAFDAMTSSRPYREAMAVSKALAELRSSAGTQFDSEVVRFFCALVEDREQLDLEQGAPTLDVARALPGQPAAEAGSAGSGAAAPPPGAPFGALRAH